MKGLERKIILEVNSYDHICNSPTILTPRWPVFDIMILLISVVLYLNKTIKLRIMPLAPIVGSKCCRWAYRNIIQCFVILLLRCFTLSKISAAWYYSPPTLRLSILFLVSDTISFFCKNIFSFNPSSGTISNTRGGNPVNKGVSNMYSTGN